jgi:hypothetical protein
MRETQGLRLAIEGLYAVFRDYPLRDYTDPCPCCHKDPDVEKGIHSKPLRILDHNDLMEYAGDALATWGDEITFRHFLPRIFELVIHGDDPEVLFQDPQNVFAKLRFGAWRSWPETEQSSVVNYFGHLWATVLETPPKRLGLGEACDWLQSIAQAESDLAPYLTQWLAAESVASYRHLARTIFRDEVPPWKTPPKDYWQTSVPQWNQLGDWLLSLEVRHKLSEGSNKWFKSPLAGEFIKAIEILQRN